MKPADDPRILRQSLTETDGIVRRTVPEGYPHRPDRFSRGEHRAVGFQNRSRIVDDSKRDGITFRTRRLFHAEQIRLQCLPGQFHGGILFRLMKIDRGGELKRGVFPGFRVVSGNVDPPVAQNVAPGENRQGESEFVIHAGFFLVQTDCALPFPVPAFVAPLPEIGDGSGRSRDEMEIFLPASAWIDQNFNVFLGKNSEIVAFRHFFSDSGQILHMGANTQIEISFRTDGVDFRFIFRFCGLEGQRGEFHGRADPCVQISVHRRNPGRAGNCDPGLNRRDFSCVFKQDVIVGNPVGGRFFRQFQLQIVHPERAGLPEGDAAPENRKFRRRNREVIAFPFP